MAPKRSVSATLRKEYDPLKSMSKIGRNRPRLSPFLIRLVREPPAAAAGRDTEAHEKRMSEPNQEPGAKKTYEPPKVMAINLRPEEAVLGNCKIGSSAGPVASSCSTLHCSTIGS